MDVYRVWAEDAADCVWLLANSTADAMEIVSEADILRPPLRAALDDKKLGVAKDLILNAEGETFTISRR